MPADQKLTKTAGTPLYMAPEAVRSIAHRGPPVDVWAAACVGYEMLHGRPAFGGCESLDALHQRIRRAAFNPFKCGAATGPLRGAISAALVADPAARPTANAMIERLQIQLG